MQESDAAVGAIHLLNSENFHPIPSLPQEECFGTNDITQRERFLAFMRNRRLLLAWQWQNANNVRVDVSNTALLCICLLYWVSLQCHSF